MFPAHRQGCSERARFFSEPWRSAHKHSVSYTWILCKTRQMRDLKKNASYVRRKILPCLTKVSFLSGEMLSSPCGLTPTSEPFSQTLDLPPDLTAQGQNRPVEMAVFCLHTGNWEGVPDEKGAFGVRDAGCRHSTPGFQLKTRLAASRLWHENRHWME